MADRLYRTLASDMSLQFAQYGMLASKSGSMSPSMSPYGYPPSPSASGFFQDGKLICASGAQTPVKNPSTPASIDAKIYTLESKARHLRLALENVELELAAARCVRGRASNASSPSCRLPESMLAEIFQLAFETAWTPRPIPNNMALTSEHTIAQQRREDEWALLSAITSTSAHWRSVALNTPRLWCKVEARLGHFDAKFRSFLERSRAAPLHITLYVDDVPSPPASPGAVAPAAAAAANGNGNNADANANGAAAPANQAQPNANNANGANVALNAGVRTTAMKLQTWIRALAPHLERAETLILRSQDQSVAGSILFPFPARMPMLKVFKWLTKGPSNAQAGLPVGWQPRFLLDLDISGCTALESIRITRRGYGLGLPLAWDERIVRNLKQLTIEGWPGFPDAKFTKLIKKCENLKGLVWIRAVESFDAPHHPDEDVPASEPLPTFENDTVEILRLDLTIHDRVSSDVFKHARFPSLKHLTIYSGDNANVALADSALIGPQATAVLLPSSSWSSSPTTTSTSLPTTSELASSSLFTAPKNRFPQLESAWLSLFTFTPERVVQFMDAHPSLRSFGCALRSSFIELVHKLAEPASVVPWVVRAPNLDRLYVICASVSWDGELQSSECVEGLCTALRALLMVRRAGAGAAKASLMGSAPGTPASGTLVGSFDGGLPWGGSSGSLGSIDPFGLAMGSVLGMPSPGGLGASTDASARPMKIHLNDQSWSNRGRIPPEYIQLRKDFPDNIILSGEEDDPPAWFHHTLP
ncbi:hypothetical protein DL93DRAFT_2225658 [Clavulina sp. PMI_390]|nr:hypothetical protein DL93DRAFT_2225658 [Clavulina sp. PMI_390]